MLDGQFFAEEEQSAGKKIWKVAKAQVRCQFIVLDEAELMGVCELNGLLNSPHTWDIPARYEGVEPFLLALMEWMRRSIIINDDKFAAFAK